MKRLITIIALALISISAKATAYNTSTTLVTTSCTSGSSSTCTASTTYLWPNQAVTGDVTISVKSSGSVLHGSAYAYFSSNSGGDFTNFKEWSNTSWSSETDSAVISISNLSTLQVKLSVDGSAGIYTSSITPTAIYVTATAASGNTVIWFNTSEKLKFLSPWDMEGAIKQMAYQLSKYQTSSGIALDAAYLRITGVDVQHAAKQVVVDYAIFATAATATAGDNAVATGTASFYDSSDGNTPLYTNNFACALGTDPFGTQPTIVTDMPQMQAYLALKNHSSMTTLLTDAIAV